ncbi:hypothetical protein M0812_29434 [Anaeramoeba flamelloides]|uniref:Uncharacterized protein n=1 Tax=Anaeramoeba flamelloides TaxID=1746091 RepID=A0AAV7Y7W7_9EUKA|nr:hypothetical protein M0812_29434 [Anaeramoeba flamelloides]
MSSKLSLLTKLFVSNPNKNGLYGFGLDDSAPLIALLYANILMRLFVRIFSTQIIKIKTIPKNQKRIIHEICFLIAHYPVSIILLSFAISNVTTFFPKFKMDNKK